MAGKLVNIKLHIRRLQRVVKESRSVCTCDCRRPNVTSPVTPAWLHDCETFSFLIIFCTWCWFFYFNSLHVVMRDLEIGGIIFPFFFFRSIDVNVELGPYFSFLVCTTYDSVFSGFLMGKSGYSSNSSSNVVVLFLIFAGIPFACFFFPPIK